MAAGGACEVFRETASGVKTKRAQLRRALAEFDVGNVLIGLPLSKLAKKRSSYSF